MHGGDDEEIEGALTGGSLEVNGVGGAVASSRYEQAQVARRKKAPIRSRRRGDGEPMDTNGVGEGV